MSLFTKNCLRIGGILFVLGIVLCGISIACGFRGRGIGTSKYNYDYKSEYDQDIKKINIDISIANITIKRGDTFAINAENMQEDSFESYVEGDTWIVKDDDKNVTTIFGFNIPFCNDDDYDYKVIITIPDGFDPEELNIKLGAGRIKLCDVETEKIDFNIGAGELICGNLTVENASKIKVGAGKVDIDNLIAKDIDLDCGAGDMDIIGDIQGVNSLNCGVGHVKLNLAQGEKDYNFTVKSGIGKVRINDDKYYFTNSHQTSDDAKNSFDIVCGVGSIEVYNH